MSFNADNYKEFSQQTSYIGSTGIFACPVAGPPGTPAEIIQLHAPVGGKAVAWSATRLSGMPQLPDPSPQNNNEALASYQIKPSCPSWATEGSPIVHVEGEYLYVYALPMSHRDQLPMGVSPIDSLSGQATTLQPSDFSMRLLSGPTAAPQPLQTIDISMTGVTRSN
jgi:hypothetical protein